MIIIIIIIIISQIVIIQHSHQQFTGKVCLQSEAAVDNDQHVNNLVIRTVLMLRTSSVFEVNLTLVLPDKMLNYTNFSKLNASLLLLF